jgi:hypothetical protein
LNNRCIATYAEPQASLGGDRIMSWTWHWWLFLAAIIPSCALVRFRRGAIIDSKIENYQDAFRTRPYAIRGIILLAGVMYAAIMTAIAGFIF